MDNINIEQELVKVNITDTIITKMKDSYMGLVVKDNTDEVGFQAVTTARKDVKSFRVKVEKILKDIRKPAYDFQKSVVAKEKEIVAKVSEIEDYLTTQELIYKPKEVEIEQPLTDDEKITLYVKSLIAVKIPELTTEKGKETITKITNYLIELTK